MRLQLKILLPIIGLFAVFLSLSGFLAYRETAENLQVALLDNMDGEAEGLSRALSNFYISGINNIRRIARQERIENYFQGDLADEQAAADMTPRLQRIIDTYEDFDRLTLLDMEGKVVATTHPQASARGSSFADREYFKSAVRGTPFVASPFMSRVSNKPVMTASAPVEVNGKVIGVAYAALNLDTFFERNVAPIQVGREGFAYIVNDKGLVVMSKNQDWLFNDKLPSVGTYKEWIASGKDGAQEYTGNDGKAVVAYHQVEPQTKLMSVVRVEADDVYSGLRDLRNSTAIIILASILIGSILVVAVIRPIVRALDKGVVFATEIANGNLDGVLDVRRNDEIGKLADALRFIPDTLKQILGEYRRLETEVERGSLDAQGDPDKFRGSFATLIYGTNSILRRFLTVLENIPSPVVILDKDLKASYINTVARSLAGDNYKGKTCQELFDRADFFTDSCALKKAVSTHQPAVAETTARPRGREMEISYNAIPMMDKQGGLTSVLQLITDLTDIKRTQRTIMEVAQQALDISNRVATASEQLSAQVGQVNQGATIQRDRVNATAAAMEEMNATVLEVARNAGESSEQAANSRAKATEGASLMQQVIDSIGQVNAVSAELANNIKALGQQTEAIGSVMGVISDIADQTNLLALNAAIEAARAGEAGRGFAVVADEVRKLAEKSMSATSEVGSSISSIQTATTQNIEHFQTAADLVQKATGLAQTSGEALNEILELAERTASLITGIATAAEQQSATSEEINHSVEEIHRIADETANGMNDAASAVHELAGLASELRALLDKLQS